MKPRIPTLNWLRVFEAAARTGSFARAANILNMSAPAVSQQIRALEGALGRKLFERGPRSVTLTDAGSTFLPTVVRALRSVESASANIFGGSENTSVTVQCSLLLAAGWLADRLPGFHAIHPDIRINIVSGIFDEELTGGEADLRLVFGMPPGPFEESDFLFGEKIFPVARPDIAATVSTPHDLLNYPLVEISTHRVNWWAFLPSEGSAPNFIHTDNTLTAFALARTGAIALAREPASSELAGLNGLVPCKSFRPITDAQGYSLIHPGEAQLRSPAAKFRAWILEEAEKSRSVLEDH